MHFRKHSPEVINYRDFKKFDNERLMNSLHYTLSEEQIDYPDKFFEMFFMNTYPEERSIFVETINHSWLKRTQNP